MTILDDIYVLEQIKGVHIKYVELNNSKEQYVTECWEQWYKSQLPIRYFPRLPSRVIKVQ